MEGWKDVKAPNIYHAYKSKGFIFFNLSSEYFYKLFLKALMANSHNLE